MIKKTVPTPLSNNKIAAPRPLNQQPAKVPEQAAPRSAPFPRHVVPATPPISAARPGQIRHPAVQPKAGGNFPRETRPAPPVYRPPSQGVPGRSIQPLMHSLAFKYEGDKRATIEKGDKRLRAQSGDYRDAPINKLEEKENLYLHAHGSTKKFGKMKPAELAKYLSDQGMPKHALRIFLLGCNTAGYAVELQAILNAKPYNYHVLVSGTPGTQWVPESGTPVFAETKEAAGRYRETKDMSNVRQLVLPSARVTALEEELSRPASRWQPDAEATQCPLCHKQFGRMLRKHHCRKCGLVVCDNCSKGRQSVVNPAVRPNSSAETGNVRVCERCRV